MQSKIPCSLSAKLSNMGFFCAILVVLLHTESINYWPSTELMRTFLIKPLGGIAVPFFFVAAGYFLAGHIHEYNWWKRETEKRLRSLLLPYFIWEALYFTYSIPFVLLANILANAPLTRNIPDIISIFALNPMQGGGLGPLWFVRTLFVFVLISPIIATPIKLSRMIGGGVVALLFVGYLWTVGFTDESVGAWGYPIGTVGLFSIRSLLFFAFGIFLREWPITQRFPKYVMISLLLLGSVLWTIYGLFSQGETSQTINLIKPFANGCVLLGIWWLIPEKPWPAYLTNATFPIYLMHFFVMVFIDRFTTNIHFLGALEEMVPGLLFKATLGVAIPTFVTHLMHAYAPKTASFLFGGR